MVVLNGIEHVGVDQVVCKNDVSRSCARTSNRQSECTYSQGKHSGKA